MCKILLFIPEFVVDNGSLVNDMDELALSSGGGIIDLFRRVLKFRVSRLRVGALPLYYGDRDCTRLWIWSRASPYPDPEHNKTTSQFTITEL